MATDELVADWRELDAFELSESSELYGLFDKYDIQTVGQAFDALNEGTLPDDDREMLQAAFEAVWKEHPDWKPRDEQEEETSLDVLKRKARHLKAIRSMSSKCREAERDMITAKERAKAAKLTWEGMVLQMQRLIDDGESGQMKLFDNDDDEDQEEHQAEAKSSAEENDEWMYVELAAIGVKGKLLEKLEDAGVCTLGEWTKWHGQGVNREPIKGVGEGAIEKIADLCEVYWKKQATLKSSGDDHADKE